jgi:thiol-disulfide isomerase/thioredoxin
MYKIIEALQKFFRPLTKYGTLILIVAIFIVVTVIAFKYFIPISAITNEKFSDVANANTRTMNADIYFFSADWCPYCVKAKPEWQTFKTTNDGKTVNGYVIKCHDVDCTKEGKDNPDTAAMMQTFQIKSFPTVKLTTDDGKKIDFDAKVSSDNLNTFINSVLA